MNTLRVFSPAPAVEARGLATITALLTQDHEPPFAIGPPAGLDPAWVTADVELAAELPCECCGHAGGAYLSFHLAGRYVAYSVCPAPACGHCNEL